MKTKTNALALFLVISLCIINCSSFVEIPLIDINTQWGSSMEEIRASIDEKYSKSIKETENTISYIIEDRHSETTTAGNIVITREAAILLQEITYSFFDNKLYEVDILSTNSTMFDDLNYSDKVLDRYNKLFDKYIKELGTPDKVKGNKEATIKENCNIENIWNADSGSIYPDVSISLIFSYRSKKATLTEEYKNILLEPKD